MPAKQRNLTLARLFHLSCMKGSDGSFVGTSPSIVVRATFPAFEGVNAHPLRIVLRAVIPVFARRIL